MKAVAHSHVGKLRSVNEDSIFYTLDRIGKLDNLFILCDGMGGENAGDYASLTAVSELKARIREAKGELIHILSAAITESNEKLLLEASLDVRKAGMGTTLVLASIKEGILYLANIGDSRLYVLDRKLIQISRDHTLAEELLSRNVITRYSPEYEENKHKLTRALGAMENVKADFFEIPTAGISKILLCSDGLSNMLSDDEIEHILREENPESAAERLVDAANKNGGRDNISAIVIYALEDKAGEADAT